MSKLISFVLFLFVASMLFLSSCDTKGNFFSIKGEITSADGQVLYLEHRGLGGLEILDSIGLKKSGKFAFKGESPKNPEFYQLRLGDQVVIFAVDSIDKLTLSADGKDLFNSYKIEPAIPNEQIRKVVNMQHNAKNDISRLLAQHDSKEIGDVEFMAEVDSVLSVYKAFANNLILGNPSGAAAYYAVFQKIDNYLIYDPYDKKDYPMFGAVATSWNRFYPETQRTKHLYDFAMNAIRARKQQEKQSSLIDNVAIAETQLPDISLLNVKGQKTNISSFRGSYVLLDFTAYRADFSMRHNEIISRVYNKYKSKGLEVYQISFDSDSHFWKNVSVELPWTTVYDPQSVYSSLLKSYNVRELPTAYIIDKEGNLIKRIEDFDKLDQYIGELL